MSSDCVNLQSQVESVLGALVKVATVELTKLFESRYRASAAALGVDLGRTEDKKENETSKSPDRLSTGDTKRSIGVQVDEDICAPLEICGPLIHSDGDCLGDCMEEEVKVVERGLIPSQILLTEVDPEWSPPKEQIVAETVDMAVDVAELSGCEGETPTDGDPQTEVIFPDEEKQHEISAGIEASTETSTSAETSGHGSTESTPTKQKPLVIQPDTRYIISKEKIKFVCPLILKPESPAPKPDSSEEPVQAEPQQACVSTAKGTAYSPSPSDGAVTPGLAGVWERILTPKKKDDLHIKLKLTSPDQKLTGRCAVQLVDVLTVPESELTLQKDGAKDLEANGKNGWLLPKDLRRHQSLHTGHRLCCFTHCEEGVWRLRKVVAHSRDGYACSICQKTFKRRKILRRHERFHTGEKPYPCSKCSKTFALRKSLRRHLRFHTGDKPHTCTKCKKSFRLRENLKAHLRFHTGEKPFSCSTCGKMFRIMKNLEKHDCGYFVPSFRTIAGL